MKRQIWLFFHQSKKLVIIALVIALVTTIDWLIFNIPQNPTKANLGVSFSPDYAQSLGLDPKQVYQSLLDDLKFRKLRIPTYWEDTEPEPNQYDFSQTDYMIDEAAKRGAKVIMVVGTKQPRWPECHIPKWAAKLNLNQRQNRVSLYITEIIKRYRSSPTIWAWQIENEPFFQFGDNCDPLDQSTLNQEVQIVRSLDGSRPIIITDTGEWRNWVLPMQLSDILGISVYLRAYTPFVGNFHYPFPPLYYQIKSRLVHQLFAPKNQQTIITELQAEPWTQNFIGNTPLNQQLELFHLSDLQGNIQFADRIGFDQVYLWGVEWWYYMRKHQHSEYFDYIKNLVGSRTLINN